MRLNSLSKNPDYDVESLQDGLIVLRNDSLLTMRNEAVRIITG